jgi:hypothetical protein
MEPGKSNGYYSTMEWLIFKTDYSAEEVKAKYQAFKESRPGNKPWLDIYDFEEVPGWEEMWVVMAGDEYRAQHHATEDLALFLSTVIKPGDYVVLTFIGDSGWPWRYLIRSMEVDKLEMTWTLSGGIPLDDFLKKEGLKK